MTVEKKLFCRVVQSQLWNLSLREKKKFKIKPPLFLRLNSNSDDLLKTKQRGKWRSPNERTSDVRCCPMARPDLFFSLTLGKKTFLRDIWPPFVRLVIIRRARTRANSSHYGTFVAGWQRASISLADNEGGCLRAMLSPK